MYPGSARITLSKELVSCAMDEDAIILNLQDGEYHEMNAVAASVWDLLQEPKTVDEIQAALLEEYDVDAQACERDLQQLLENMAKKELIQVDTGEGA